MGDKLDFYKHTLDFLKGNKVFLMLVTALMGGGTIGYNIPDLLKVKPVEVTVTAPKATPVIIKGDCSKCDAEIEKLKAQIKELEKLKRWH